MSASNSFKIVEQQRGYLHLRIEDASIRLDNADGLIKRRQSVWSPLAIGDHSRQIEFQILWLKLRSKIVADALALASGNLHVVPCGRQVTDYLWALLRKRSGPKTTSNEGDADGFWLFVGKREESLGWVTVH